MKSKIPGWLGIVPFVLIAFVFLFNFLNHAKMPHPGKAIYSQHCENCHGISGQGIQSLIPPVFNSDYAMTHFYDIPCYIKKGLTDSILVNNKWYNQSMYPIQLNEIQIANVMNYINEEMNLNQKPITSGEVKTIINNCR